MSHGPRSDIPIRPVEMHPGAFRRALKRQQRGAQALAHTRRLTELRILTSQEAADRINRIRREAVG